MPRINLIVVLCLATPRLHVIKVQTAGLHVKFEPRFSFLRSTLLSVQRSRVPQMTRYVRFVV